MKLITQGTDYLLSAPLKAELLCKINFLDERNHILITVNQHKQEAEWEALLGAQIAAVEGLPESMQWQPFLRQLGKSPMWSLKVRVTSYTRIADLDGNSLDFGDLEKGQEIRLVLNARKLWRFGERAGLIVFAKEVDVM